MKDELTTVEYGLVDKNKLDLVIEKTPDKYIKHRQGRGNMIFDYVEAGYMIDRLNKIFNYMWSFEVKESKVNQSMTQVAVLGKLTGFIVIPSSPPIVQAIVKEQWGGSDIKKSSTSGSPIDIADDYKAASTDAMKKCASMIGIAADIYWKSAKEEAKGDNANKDPFIP